MTKLPSPHSIFHIFISQYLTALPPNSILQTLWMEVMESLFSQFTFLSDQACSSKAFDPSTIEDLMKLFEIEAYNSWAAAELQAQQEYDQAEESLQQAEEHLDSVMEDAMNEFYRFEAEMERMEKEELDSLNEKAERARMMGKGMEKAAYAASKKYVESALGLATASMKSAWKKKGMSSGTGSKVHPN